ELGPGAPGGFASEGFTSHLVAGSTAEVLEGAAAPLDVAGGRRELPARPSTPQPGGRGHGDAHGAGRGSRTGGAARGGVAAPPRSGGGGRGGWGVASRPGRR